jgi:hypothetical protein
MTDKTRDQDMKNKDQQGATRSNDQTMKPGREQHPSDKNANDQAAKLNREQHPDKNQKDHDEKNAHKQQQSGTKPTTKNQ